MKKKGFELAVNFLVIMIISIVIFSLGIVFVKKIFSSAEKTQDFYFQQYEKEVQELLCDTRDIVCVPRDTQNIVKDKRPLYGIVITNIDTTPTYFKLSVNFDKAYKKDNSDMCVRGGSAPLDEAGCGNPQDWIKYVQEPFLIKPNSLAKKPIALGVKSPQKGTYAFDVQVLECTGHNPLTDCNTNSAPYQALQKIYLYVP